jgi:hypothetical protein
LRIVVAAEDAAVDRRVERLQPPAHHLREAGVLGHVADLYAFAFQVLSGTTGAVNLHTGRSQPAGEDRESQLVADADQGTFDLRRLHLDSFPGTLIQFGQTLWAAERPGHNNLTK